MEAYAQVLLYAIPGFVILVALESVYAYAIKGVVFRGMDIISSLSSGITNLLKDVLKLTVVIIGYDMVYEHVALINHEPSWIVYALAFIGLDFASYWHHRLAHKVNIFWNRHVIHHSGEDFNMATALRQSISVFVSLGFIFLFPAALLGVPPEVIAVVAPSHLFMQFWYHTEMIGKMGWLEYIIVTPSQHRVHHAMNSIYLDKNLAAIFCVWDRAFGTFQEELDEHPPVYGVTRQVNTWNPIKINFQHLFLLIKDAWYAQNWIDKLKIWFMPTGWRPADVAERFPVISADSNNFEKYNPPSTFFSKCWTWFQFIVLILMLWHFLLKIADIAAEDLLVYAVFMFLHIYSFTTLMDWKKSAFWTELVKSIFGIGILYWLGDWFLVEEFFVGLNSVVLGYLIFSPIVVGWIVVSKEVV